MYRLMNSAMMPVPGTYALTNFTQDEFVDKIRYAHEKGILASYIGYEQTADFLTTITGVPISVNRAETVVETGDYLLICKLKYRVGAGTKGQPIDESDFIFQIAYYISYTHYRT